MSIKKVLIGISIVLISLVLVAVISLLAFVGYHKVKKIFLLSKVDVAGCKRISAPRVIALAGIDGQTSLLFLDSSSIKRAIEKNPVIKVLDITKQYPDTLKITIEERKPLMLIKIDTSLYEISKDGYIIGNDNFSLPVLSEFPLNEGTRQTNTSLLYILKTVGECENAKVLDAISEIEYSEKEIIIYPRILKAKILINHEADCEKLQKLYMAMVSLASKEEKVKRLDFRFETLIVERE